MKLFKKIIFIVMAFIISIAAICGVLKAIGKDQKFLITAVGYYFQPSEDFDPNTMAKKTDYSADSNWLTLPARVDEADLTPLGIASSINDGSAPADVFYIHGTGYTKQTSWTYSISPGTATGDNAKFSLANEASIFNGCCNIYAPHYREASIFAYIGLSKKKQDIILDAIYEDIADAFDYFVKHHNQNRPIVIASHSQGTHLAMRLLRDIDKDPVLASRVVTAYLIGSGPVSLDKDYINSLTHFTICTSPSTINCLVHWDTYGENGSAKIFASPEKSICINPLSWQEDEQRSPATQHLGAASISGTYTLKMDGEDKSENVIFHRQPQLATQYTWAQCRDGFLYVEDQSGTDYEKLGKLPDKSYHGIDFPLFYGNIRENIQNRISQYLEL
ncbi:MAG: DUF3089 domain-containing protein [Cellvibrio sp.]|uniref:DUF3089 domain-containing protein n=1 Tax=Cellvibrio sp. TaxID=1965322 RepID=UPI0031B2E33B